MYIAQSMEVVQVSVSKTTYTSTLKKILKISGNVGMTSCTGEKSMVTRVGMEHVQEQPHVQLSTSYTHINISTCGVSGVT